MQLALCASPDPSKASRKHCVHLGVKHVIAPVKHPSCAAASCSRLRVGGARRHLLRGSRRWSKHLAWAVRSFLAAIAPIGPRTMPSGIDAATLIRGARTPDAKGSHLTLQSRVVGDAPACRGGRIRCRRRTARRAVMCSSVAPKPLCRQKVNEPRACCMRRRDNDALPPWMLDRGTAQPCSGDAACIRLQIRKAARCTATFCVGSSLKK